MGVRGFRSWFESQFPKAIHEIAKESSNESFDHVLVDVNSLLHVCLRKSRTDGHALVLFMKELDAIVELATPLQCLVLAMDGPPGAAKLATQRKRRYQTVVRSELKHKQIESFLNYENNNGQTRKAKSRMKKLMRKKDRMQRELKTLRLTPATEFMERAVEAMEYWAWQRLNARHSTLAQKNVTIFISPSTASGEGEIKLLEWLRHKPRRGESVAFIGGDSDLVLESFLVPLSSTHNVFVLLPDGNKRILVVSTWEATRKLALLTKCVDFFSLIRVRTDFVLLLILNGNDYLPKIRACATFNRLYHTYINLRKQAGDVGYLVDPITLEINTDFAIQYFAELAKFEAALSFTETSRKDSVSPLNVLHNLVSAHLLPSPVKFLVDGGEGEEENDDDDLDDDIDSSDGEIDDSVADDDFDLGSDLEMVRHQLLLGDPDSEDFLAYEVWVPKDVPAKRTRHTLASMVLSDMQNDDESEDEDDGIDLSLFTCDPVGYEWEVKEKLPPDVSEYLYGLLWNLQTYQDGICADYGFNYGKRSGPTPSEIVTFLEEAKQNGTKLVPQYFHEPLKTPMPAGLSSLAALPSSLSSLIPHPYNMIGGEKADQLFAKSMSPFDNVFDVQKFESICHGELESLGVQAPTLSPDDHHWKTLSLVGRPLNQKTLPPKKFADRMMQLRPSNRIRRSTVAAAFEPKTDREDFASIGPFLSKIQAVDRLEYRLAYRKKGERRFPKGKVGELADTEQASDKTLALLEDQIGKSLYRSNVAQATAETRYIAGSIPDTPMKNSESNTAVGVLTNLTSGSPIKVKWERVNPSPAVHHSENPDCFELVRLHLWFEPRSTDQSYQEADLILEKDRQLKPTSESRKLVENLLAATALAELVGSGIDWRSLTVKEIRKHIGQAFERNTASLGS